MLNYSIWCMRFGKGLTKPQKKAGYASYLKESGVSELVKEETNKYERAAWKVRSYMANKLRQ